MSLNEKAVIVDEEGLSSEESLLLEHLLKGEFSGTIKEDRIPRREIFSPVALSFGQRRLWILDQLVPGNAFYNVPLVFRLEGELSKPAFTRSINEIVARHESLRTVFVTENDEPVQKIIPEMEIQVPVISLEHLPGLEQEQELIRCTTKEALKPFDLLTGPLMRITLVQLGARHHILMYTSHHIVSDTWSSDNFVNELITLYSAFCLGQSSPLPNLTVQYPDFALWQRERMQGETLEKQLAYWKAVLGPSIPILELPTDRPRPPVQNFNGDTLSFVIEEPLFKQMLTLTLKMQCSMFMTLLAALNVLFYRYSGQEDILIGSPIANRTKKEIEELIGYFSNTLVFRTDLSGNPSFGQLLERVRKMASGAYDNQDIPFEQLVEKFQPERYMSLTPLFQVMLVLQNVPKQEMNVTGTGLSISSFSVHNKTCKFDLWISFTQYGNVLSGLIEYNSDIFRAATVKRLIRHFIKLVEEVVLTPNVPISDIPILLPEEKEQLLMEWNNTGRDYSIRCLHQLFARQVEKTPDQIAVTGRINQSAKQDSQLIDGDHTGYMTYSQLDNHSGNLAQLLMDQGVTPDSIVGIMAERSLEMVTGILGILYAGGAYLPLDPEYPADRIDYMVADSGITIVLSDRIPLVTEHRSARVSILDLTKIESIANTNTIENTGNIIKTANVNSLAYVIYTSGSTGKPKGAMITHAAICNRLLWMQETYQLSAGDRVLQKTPFSFDVSVWEFFLPVLNGAVLVMAIPNGHKDSIYLKDVILKEKITIMHFVPSMLKVFLEEPGVSRIRSLKRVICSGEALASELVEQFYSLFKDYPAIELHNLYGPTEASVDVTSWVCPRGLGRKTIPIGRPIANTQLYILDRNLNPVPIGVPGQLYIAGVQLARGYLNRPELTLKTFCLRRPGGSFYKNRPLDSRKNVPNNYSTIYSTGDLTRWQPDGTIEFLGRMDFQVKVRGIRIELGEIESTLRKHPGIKDAILLTGDGAAKSGSNKITAYLVPEQNYGKEEGNANDTNMNWATGQVDDWQVVFDEAYSSETGQMDPEFNIAGWNSSYTNEPLPPEQMRIWVDSTVQRILSLKPETIMEIGCGTGLFLFPLIPHCKQYIGTDIAANGLNYIRHHLEKMELKPGWAEVQLHQRNAENFDGIAQNQLDLVILNSVVQYFPSAEYLVKVLLNAVDRVKPGGHVFIGDVRHQGLLKLFHASVAFYQATQSTGGETVLRNALNKMSLEQELVIHPTLFYAFKKCNSKIKQVEVLVKYGRYTNELSKFRYDVVIHIGDGKEKSISPHPPIRLAWNQEIHSLPDLKTRLTEMKNRQERVVVTGLPNGRLTEDTQVMQWLTGNSQPATLGEYRGILHQGNTNKSVPEPDDLLELARELGYQVVISPSAGKEDAAIDAVFHYCAQSFPTQESFDLSDLLHINTDLQSWNGYTNNPLLVKSAGQLIPELREFIKERLPEYMMPSHFVLLDRFPLTSNGKLDRRTLMLYEPLRKSVAGQDGESAFVEPQTPTEKHLATIWASVLFLEKVGVRDNFFELGGDSINAIQVISRANKEGHNLTIRDLYQNLTVSQLAQYADKSRKHSLENETEKPLVPENIWKIVLDRLPSGAEIEDLHPVTPLQKHMLNHLLTNPAKENEPGLFVTYRAGYLGASNFDFDLVQAAYERVTARFPYLRMAFMWEGLEEPVQVIYKSVKNRLGWHDWSQLDLTQQEKEEKFDALALQDYKDGFSRDKPEVYRITLVKLTETDYRFVLSADYMRVDGWSTTLVLGEFGAYIRMLVTGEPIEPLKVMDNAYRDFHLWLKNQDPERGEQFWRGMLNECTFPTLLAARAPGNDQGHTSGFTRQYRYLSLEETHQLESSIKKNQLVLSTIGWAAWAMVLSRSSVEKKVIFGILVSGRSSAQSFVETMVGQTLNVLPAQVDLSRDKPLWEFLKEIWEVQMEMSQYEFTPQEKIRDWWNVPVEKKLFESYLVVMNFPGIRQGMKEAKTSTRTVHEYLAQLEYPLRIDFYPGAELCLIMHYYRRYFNDASIKKMLDDLFLLVNEIPKNLHRSIHEMMELI